MSMLEKKNKQRFDKAYHTFILGSEAKEHKKAILYLLSFADLDQSFRGILKDKDIVNDFFLQWIKFSKNEKYYHDEPGLQELAIKSKEYFESKKYKKLVNLYFDMAFRHLCGHLEVDKRSDFKQLTDLDLCEKGIIPEEVLIQYFLLETYCKNTHFSWDRNDEICLQNLACLILCFGDIYDFMHEEECCCPECSKQESILTAVQKIPRNAPCPCGTLKADGEPVKYKNCCGN
ncbi:MAG: hypothetical protein UT32_C0033G0007 [Parcubacteria group bacterium GW2011_GWC2_39_14]|nr:MAG: hypothetical protein UT32_C0033G0007 [Parcubacteria group bacterium GW2011_GWC2_39_14]KKR54222.1 MAG: hypothetical protein UT91_C0019G0008 [Parcubacteria group bacterium GW2011_GWA2_40_23]